MGGREAGRERGRQGVVTYVSPVETFANGNQAIKVVVRRRSRDQGKIRVTEINGSTGFSDIKKGVATVLSFEPKRSRRSEGTIYQSRMIFAKQNS